MPDRNSPIEELKKMSLEEASAQISAAVYQATLLIERLESAGLVLGNGHHARQKIAQLAVAELKSRWHDNPFGVDEPARP